MTLRARLFGLFPMLWLAGSGACVLHLAIAPGVVSVLALLVVLYLVPVATYRLHDALWPLVEGSSRIDAPGYAPWWGGHQCQLMYSAFPALEAALRLVRVSTAAGCGCGAAASVAGGLLDATGRNH
jgi:hypothetical protein